MTAALLLKARTKVALDAAWLDKWGGTRAAYIAHYGPIGSDHFDHDRNALARSTDALLKAAA